MPFYLFLSGFCAVFRLTSWDRLPQCVRADDEVSRGVQSRHLLGKAPSNLARDDRELGDKLTTN